MIRNTILILITLNIFQVKAQNNASFLNDYYKFNLEFGGAYFSGAKTTNLPNDGTIYYSFQNYIAPRFGLQYDFLRKKNFNFKVGFTTLLLREKELFHIDKSEVPLNPNYANYDVSSKIETFSGDWQFNIPITLEYILNKNKPKFSINVNYIIGYQNYYYTETDFVFGDFGQTVSEGATGFKGTHSRGNNVWHPSAQIGFGMYFPFKKWMLRTNLYYNIMLEKMFEGEYEWKNFQNHPDISGDYSFSGNSFGIEFSIYLAKKNKKHNYN